MPRAPLSGYARDASYRKSDVTPALSYMNFRKPPSHCPCTARDIESGEVLKSRSPARGPPRRERVRACEPLREEDRGGSEWRREEEEETDICILFREGRRESRRGRPWSRCFPISTIAHLCTLKHYMPCKHACYALSTCNMVLGQIIDNTTLVGYARSNMRATRTMYQRALTQPRPVPQSSHSRVDHTQITWEIRAHT